MGNTTSCITETAVCHTIHQILCYLIKWIGKTADGLSTQIFQHFLVIRYFTDAAVRIQGEKFCQIAVMY